jgi:hypothetical protein
MAHAILCHTGPSAHASVLPFDNRYLSYLRRANLLPIANIVYHGMSIFNAPAITAMVDRWRSKTHSFHLSRSEIMVTLEDVAMILGLSIRGQVVTDLCDPVGWRQRVADFLGRNPLNRPKHGKGHEVRLWINSLQEKQNLSSAFLIYIGFQKS